MRAFIDTNVLLYAVDTAEPEKRAAAVALLGAGVHDFVVSTQVLSEFYVVSTRRLATPLSEEDATAYIDDLESLPVVALDLDHVRDAIRLSRGARLAYWDGLILAAARSAGCEILLTEDLSHGATIDGVRIENPFLAAG